MQTPSDPEAAESASPHLMSVLPSLGEAVATIGARFDQHGAMGLLLIDASVALAIEERYGEEAASRSLGALGELVSELAGELLPPDDLVVAGETGRSELLVIFFRDIGAGDFLSQELPDFESTLATLLEQRGLSVFYPYLRTAPRLPMAWVWACTRCSP